MKKKSFVPYIVAFVLFASSIGFMIYSGLNEGSVYFLNVSEALANEQGENTSMRLFGEVGSFTKSQTGDNVEFELVDIENPQQKMKVRYQGVIPDTFDHGVEVITEGKLVSNATFEAKTLMTKCPSKYEKENRT